MSQNLAASQVFGEMMLEEILVRAGLGQPTAIDPNNINLSFKIVVVTDADVPGIAIRCERIGKSPLELQLNFA